MRRPSCWSFSPGSSASTSMRESSLTVAGSNLGVVNLLDVGWIFVAGVPHRFLVLHLLGGALFLVLGRLRLVLHLASFGSGVGVHLSNGRARRLEVLSTLRRRARRRRGAARMR